VSATCVRVPVLRAHRWQLLFECERPITPAQVRELLRAAPGVKLVDGRRAQLFSHARDASGQDPILVGRIRQDLAIGRALHLPVCGG